MKQTTPHIAMLPSPGMGHIIPMVEFAKRLILKHDLSITLIIPDSGLHPNEEKPFLEALPEGINLIILPRPYLDDLQTDQIQVICFTIARSLSSLRNVFRSLVATENLVALVVDFLGTAAFDVANEFNISTYMFFPSNAMFLSLNLYLPELDATVSGPFEDLPEPVQVPGCIPLLAEDLMQPLDDRECFAYKWLVNEVKRYKMAVGIVVNTFNGVEDRTIKALMQKENYPPVYPIGPLVRQTDAIKGNKSAGESASMIMKWLNDQPQGSVLFICFGSLGLLSQAQVHELAYGLEMSEKGFLWAIRSPNADPLSLLPQGFVERTQGRGLLVSSWAPQTQILSHGSTGGFLTHCGWNSVQESIVNGVPMIAWPLYAEQKMNAALLTKGLKVALRPGVRDEDRLVGRIEIANSVKNLMEGEQGKQLRERTRALKDAAKMEQSEDGHSTKSLADFVRLLKPKIN